MASGLTEQSTAAPPRPAFYRRPRVLIAMGLLVGLLVFHQPLLAAAYRVMVVHEAAGKCSLAMIVTGTPECYDKAAALIQDDAVETVLIVADRPSRSERIGASPKSGDIATNELTKRGVAADRIRLIETQTVTPHQLFREVDKTINALSGELVIVISTSTLSRYHRKVINQALAANRSSSYRVRAVVHKDVDADRWWRSRSGVRDVLNHGLRLAFVTCRGESDIDTDDPYEHLVPAQQARVSSDG